MIDGARRVLMTTDTLGGVWSYVVELARALSARSVEVGIATVGGRPDPGQRKEAAGIAGARLFPSDFRAEWMEDPWKDVQEAGEWLRSVAGELAPDVVHLNGYMHGALEFDVPVLVVGHSCVLSWWEAVRDEPAPPAWSRYRETVARGIRAADRVVAPTRHMLRSLDRHYGPLPAARVIPNGRSADRFRPLPEEPVVFACGRLWDEAKNLHVLDRAAADLPWPVEVAGSLSHPDGGERVAGNVRCLGVLPPEDVARRMGRAAIVAHPARYEPFGLVPLEAALCGCALVLGDIPTLREVWGNAALFVDPDDASALAAALGRLIASEPLRRSLSESARARALRLSPSRMADAYRELYAEMVDGSARRGGLGTLHARTPQGEGLARAPGGRPRRPDGRPDVPARGARA